jgi:YHS domain-containing protein/mono/diheme cytochrome c family protein
MLHRAICFVPTLFVLGGLATADEIEYARDVHPILRDHCFTCHGPEKQKGKLRLDTREGLFGGKDGEQPVVPGKPDVSLLYELVTLPHDDPDVMPAEGEPLTGEQLATLKKWIEAGAPWTAVAAEEGRPAGPALDLPELSAEQQAAISSARGALEERGLPALPVAAGLSALDVNFSLQREKVGDAEVALLAGLEPCLVWLNLSGTALTDAALAQVGRCGELRRLNISNTKVSDAGLAQLAGLGKLTYLNLYGTGVTDAGLARLAGLAQLEKLYLWQTQVTDAGVARLQEALPKLTVNRGAALAAITPRKAGPINTKCPVSGADIDPARVSVVDSQAIGFCCEKCKAKFDADPAAFLSKVVEFQPLPVNAKCPVSGADVDPTFTSQVDGQLVAFCCEKCKAKFDADPAPFLAKLSELKRGEQAKGPVNETCPVSGKPVDVAVVSTFEGKQVAFCCAKCKGAFDKDPASFKDKVAAVSK